MHICMDACTHSCLLSGLEKKKHNEACVLSNREEEKGGAREFLPAGSYLTSSAIMPARRTCKTTTHSNTKAPIP